MRISRRTIGTLLVAAVAVTGCGTNDDLAGRGEPHTGGPGSTDTAGGWLGGEPDWSRGGGTASAGEAAAEHAAAGTDRMSREMATDEDSAVPGVPGTGTLRAGSVDDNADFDGFLSYLERLRTAGIVLRDLDPAGRIVVEVTGRTGLPVAGAAVVVSADGSEVARLRTTADGTARFHPTFYEVGDVTSFDVAVGSQSVTAAPGDTVAIGAAAAGGAEGPVPVDVLFLLDATGSMGDEIDRLKMSIDSVAARLDGLESAPDVRFAMTLYRDEGDAFVTSTYDFTSDADEFRGALAEVVADGGGDYPEALDEGLAEALAAPAWRDPADAVQLVFLVADAPPHVDRQVEAPYTASVRDAAGRGVKIFPVASSESDDQAEGVFRQLAQATGARFVFLSYGAAGAATGGNTDIDATDYEELALEDLVVRLVAEELDSLSGERTEVSPASTTTTAPPGQ